MRVSAILLFLTVCISGTQKYWLPVVPPYDLRSPDRYTKYMPARLRSLQNHVKNYGISQAVLAIQDDRDLESFLFIIELGKTEKLLAYGRQKQFFNKTAQELQKLIFPNSTEPRQQIANIFDNLISTAYKGDTYRSFVWRLKLSDEPRPHVAYVHLMDIDNKKYVIGVVVSVDIIPDYIILSHRVKTLLSRLKKNNFEHWLDLIINDREHELYFEIDTVDKPYRYIASGSGSESLGESDQGVQGVDFKICTSDDCNKALVWDNFSRIARNGGGYNIYLWRNSEKEPIELRLAYICPFVYNKNKLYLFSDYTPPWFKDYVRTEFPVAVDRTLDLIKTIGFDNAVSALRRTNNKRLQVFVFEADYPYHTIENFESRLRGKTASEATAYARKISRYAIDYTKLLAGMSTFAREVGGFYAYEYRDLAKYAPIKLKMAYLKPVTVTLANKQKQYIVGATYATLADK